MMVFTQRSNSASCVTSTQARRSFRSRHRRSIVERPRIVSTDLNGLICKMHLMVGAPGVEAIPRGTARALAMTYAFARHRRVLDLRGGTGSFPLALLRQHPHIEATLFDVPAVAALARQRLAGSPVATRLQIVEGDFFTDPLPVDHDAILLANVCHNFLPERNRALLGRVRACWGPPVAGRFFDRSDAYAAAHGRTHGGGVLLVTGEGDVYS